ncbi:MAG TPA: YHYH protein [Candidatus Cybelea sp.]|nr:YHYH protein [Candidatus Cybelea sp.]
MKRINAVFLTFSLAGCGGGLTSAGSSAAVIPSSQVRINTSEPSASALTALPLDDNRYTSAGPKKSWVYLCANSIAGGGPPVTYGPWIDRSAGTWNELEKVAVEGSVAWRSQFANSVSGATRMLSGNGLPSHKTGTFPISSSDPAYQYDQNPNAISAQSLSYRIPAKPAIAAEPSCLNMGPIGVMTTGAVLFNALDALGHDAAAHEVLDSCWGHPQMSGLYHYHTFSSCMNDSSTGHSRLLGYALDGFGIYGPRGENGTVTTDATLDACHGHTHVIEWNGKRLSLYHYHMTYEYPYSLGCYKGTPTV